MKKYTADFETATWYEDRTYVWAWAVCEIGNDYHLEYGNDIESFLEFCRKSNNSTFYFHNLKFDSEFIICYLLENGFTYASTKEEIKDKTFTTIISDMGMFYELKIYFKKSKKKATKVTIYDSLKIIPFSVKEIAKAFNLEESKLELDYLKKREEGHILTKEEKDYITNDVLIVAKALNVIFNEKLNKMTQGSNALHDFKEIIGKDKFNHLFPHLPLELDLDLRKGYKGGFTYLNPLYKEKEVGKGSVLDVNSLYPYVLRSKSMPYGEPVYYEGKYEYDFVYPLYMQMLVCEFKIKENKIPTIQLKKSKVFMPNEYIRDSGDEPICLVLTSVDLKLFLEQYEIKYIKYICGWKFKSKDGIFDKYIDKWITRKIEASKEGNKGQRTLAKLMLNSLYGKFATSLVVGSKYPIVEDGVVHYKMNEEEIKEGLYLPIGAFTTAYAREITIRTAQSITDYSILKYGKDLFYYSDTDSLHSGLSLEELKQFCDIDDNRLGAWKCEGVFDKAKFIRQKCYIEDFNGEIKITCAGLPKTCYDYVTWENFKTGFSCGGKLTYSHVKGGIILKETEFTIKEEKLKKNIEEFL